MTLPAAAEWLRISSPDFQLFTDAGEKAGLQAINRLEQIRQVFRDIGGEWKQSPIPVRIYLFASEAEYSRYRPSATSKGFFQGGPERNLIVIQSWGEETGRVVFHEYVHLVLNHCAAASPQWLEEGTAEFYSTARPGKEKVVIGGPIDNHLRTLALRPWLTAGEFSAVTKNSPIYDEPERIGIFYAQSWALVHMLHFSPGYRQQLPRYAELLAEGTPAEGSFQEAFGKPFDSALQDLKLYVSAGRWRTLEVEWKPPSETAIEVESLSESESHLALADLQMQLGLWDVSGEELRKVARQTGSSPEIETARGMIAMSRRDFEQARTHFETAIAAGSRRASTYLEYAMLLRETGGERREIVHNLQKTVELNPNYAEAWFLLGLIASNEGRQADAIAPLRRAAGLLPRQSHFWHALAMAYVKTGQEKEARLAARCALEAAKTKQEVEMAEAALRLIREQETRTELANRPEVITPKGWFNRQGDSRTEGTLYRIDCLGASARLHIRTHSGNIALLVRDPGTVELKNAPSVTFEFTCGEPPERKVAVEYIARINPQTGTAGEVTSIEFR